MEATYTSAFTSLILVGVEPTFVVGAREILVVVGEVVHEELAFAVVVVVVEIAVVVRFGGHFRRADETHVVEG